MIGSNNTVVFGTMERTRVAVLVVPLSLVTRLIMIGVVQTGG